MPSARSADALAIALGALLGARPGGHGPPRGIYLVDITGLVVVVALLLRRPLAAAPVAPEGRQSDWHHWLPPLVPLLVLTVVATAIPALMQSALPWIWCGVACSGQPCPRGPVPC
jgi:hypothetical protein